MAGIFRELINKVELLVLAVVNMLLRTFNILEKLKNR